MKTQHTQGEWLAKDGQIYPLETGVTLATIPYFDKENEEQQSNARLIASAPDLLDACLSVLESINQMMKDETLEGCKMALEQAILKATINS